MKSEEHVRKAHSIQKEFFATHNTKAVPFRIRQLKKLRKAIKDFEPQLMEALKKDLNKSEFESYGTEIGFVFEEITTHLKHLKKWAKTQPAKTNLLNFKSNSYLVAEPYGQVLIISPWNYPFMLLFSPLVGAIAAGNTATLKPSPYTPNVATVMRELIESAFDPAYINVFEGNRDMNKLLLDLKWDYIFFTGSPSLGKIVMREASKFLTPVSLELGGKNPTIVTADADIKLAAKRIAWGKTLNAGQTCLAPDYVLIDKQVKDKFMQYVKDFYIEFYGEKPEESEDYGRIVNTANVERLETLMKNTDIYHGGQTVTETRFVAPTILNNVKAEDPIMQQEIFGPILPIIEFGKLDEAIQFVNKGEKPLSLYLFTSSKKTEEKILTQTSSGAVGINEVVMHVANNNLPFGGVGNSGMGAYHGQYSFETFSHMKPVLNKSTLIDVPVRYAPYSGKMGIAKTLLN